MVPSTTTVTVVLSGVSGVGKSSVAAELVAATGWAFLEGDDMHTPQSRARMTAGLPLYDSHRLPWLRAIASWIGKQEDAACDAVLTCSALRRSHRDVLSAGHPSVHFVQLTASAAVLERRMLSRTGHFMPATLLPSQLATLEPLHADEPGTVVAANGEPRQVAAAILRLVSKRIDHRRREQS